MSKTIVTKEEMRNEVEQAFENWYGGWILTHPAYWKLQEILKPAIKYAYFQGCIYASDRMEAKLDEVIIDMKKKEDDFSH